MNFWKSALPMICVVSELALCSCKKEADVVVDTAPVKAKKVVFEVKGKVKELKPDGRTVVIAHEAVPDYMPAMTMPFEVHDTNELRGLLPGDEVQFRMTVTDVEAWISHITKPNTPPGTTPPSRGQWYATRDVDTLSIGDPLPEYHFTNELGVVINTAQFKGQALVFTFFFTACPFPTFCPFLSNSFEGVQKKLEATADAPSNWHLLSISFDTEHDSPTVLEAYGHRYQYDPKHWSLATGDRQDITAIGDQVGAYFGHDENGGIIHNLRTVVVDAKGRIQKIFTDNKWTPDELTAEIVKAAAVK